MLYNDAQSLTTDTYKTSLIIIVVSDIRDRIPLSQIKGLELHSILCHLALTIRNQAHLWVSTLRRNLKPSMAAPMLLYLPSGVSGISSIVIAFFVKDMLDFSSVFLASLSFWAGIPWALKVPIGHLLDLSWRWRRWYLAGGITLVGASLIILIALLEKPLILEHWLPIKVWYVLASVLGPVGFLLQDVVADALSVSAVVTDTYNDTGGIQGDQEDGHVFVQSAGRVISLLGGIFVGLINLTILRGVQLLSLPQQLERYDTVLHVGLLIPALGIMEVIADLLTSVSTTDRRPVVVHLR